MNASLQANKNPNRDEQGRLIKFKTRKGTSVYRPHDLRHGGRVYRDHFAFKVMVQGRRYYFALDGEKEAAGKKADEIAAFLSVTTNTIAQAIERFSPQKIKTTPDPRCPTVGELVAAYEQVANAVSERTKRECIGAIRRVASFILGYPPFRGGKSQDTLAQWRQAVDKVSVASITPERIESLRGTILKAAGTDEIKKGRAIVTANAILRNAACLWSPRMRRLYTSFVLPDPCPFKTVGQMEERPHRYVSRVDVGALVKAARSELGRKRRAEFVVFVLSLFGGLRRGEIDRLIWDQIDFDQKHIWIRTTPYFRPKARNSESRVDCPDEVFGILRNFKHQGVTPPFVIPGADPANSVRCRPTFQNLTRWLRKNGIQETKALHTLRKEAGSYIFHLTGSADKAAEFLRNDPRTAREYYLGRKDRLEVQIGGLA